MKTYIMVDIEANGPIPGEYSMTSFAAVIVNEKLDTTFHVGLKPISEKVDPNRKHFASQVEAIDAKEAMQRFKDWIAEHVDGEPVFISDNNGFDWMFVCWYFWHFLGENPFGYNSMNLNSLNKGVRGDLKIKLDTLRKRALTHNALEDAKDNAKVFLKIRKDYLE